MLVRRQGDEAVREVHKGEHLDFLRMCIQDIVRSQETLRSSSYRGVGRHHLSNCRNHGLFNLERLGRQSHEDRSQQPNVLELGDRGPCKARSASSTTRTHSDLQEDARNGDPISPFVNSRYALG